MHKMSHGYRCSMKNNIRSDNTAPSDKSDERYVKAVVIARRYSISSRWVLLLAAQGKLPHIRLGAKAVRFSEAAVAKALEAQAPD